MNLRLSNRGLWNQAVNSALIAGGLTGIALSPGQALAQTAAAPATPAPESKSDQPTQLDTVEVTGSRIRRVDLETASPIFVIDRKMIETSGVQTVGELVQDLPAIAGAATNPRVNNGGGDGAATISLRGLGSNRTLVLLNGRRAISVGESLDVNAIPINLIERVEVLKDGASAIYGSDAIGGVVNFITRKDFTGSELALDAGDSSRRDGKRSGVKLSFGNSAGKVNIMGGANYQNQAQITAGNRQFASHALYLYSGVVTAGGSSRTPTGRLFLTAATRSALGYPATGCSSVTRNVGAIGNDASAAGGQYHCFTGADLFNYQPYNLVLTPQERGNLFTVANYSVSDDIDAYTEIFFDHTRSGFQIAPLPFDSRPDGVTISAQNVYNPFNQDFGGGLPSNQNATFRMLPLGTRHSVVETNVGQINLGVKGNLFATDWRWNVGGSYGRAAQENHVDGYLFRPALVNALGPSFDNADNDPSNGIQQPTCGTANTTTTGAPPPSPTIVPNCTPLDIFNLNLMVADPAQAAQLATAAARYTNTATRTQKIFTVNFDGPIVNLPAGPLQLAVGAERRDQQLANTIDFLTQGQPPLFLSCDLAQETCTNPTHGGLNVFELYGELLVPLVSNMPAVESLNLSLGTRRSDYNRYGTTTNSKVALEYRPISDVLVRGTWQQVFRAPTVTDLFEGITANAPTFNDPCTNLTSAQLAANPNLASACVGVAPDTGFSEPNGQVTGRIFGNSTLVPETGKVLTYGAVYDPSWLNGLSLEADVWHYTINNTIEVVDVNTTANICANTGDPTFCNLIVRDPSNGVVDYIDQPIFNLGTLKSDGVDLGFKYNLPNTFMGQGRFGVDATYINKWERNAAPGFTQTQNVAGQYSKQDGNYSRWRAIGFAQWKVMDFDALITPRYIGHVAVFQPDGANPNAPPLNVGSVMYWNVSLGYDLARYKTSFRVGADNVFDKQPPLLYQNNVINANTDVQTYDTIGAYLWASVTKNF